MARHRRDDQDMRAFLDAFAIEMLELPERLAEQDLLVDRYVLAPDVRLFESEFGLAVRGGRIREHFEARRDDRPHRAVAPWIGGIVEPAGAEPG